MDPSSYLIVRLILDKYKYHPSVLAIIQNPAQVLGTFTFQEVGNQEVGHLLKSLDGRKSTGEDKIPPKLVSLAANELTNNLTTAINCSIFEIPAFQMMQKKRQSAL